MNVIEITREPEVQTQSFWQRQFASQATAPQLIFDTVFGVVGPVVCFVFDPIAFRGNFIGPLFPDSRVFVYLVSALEIVVLLAWLGFGQRLRWQRLIGGNLLAGSVLCAVIGIVLSPFSLMGLVFFFIGLLGFTPFVTAFVYFRNGYRAIQSERPEVAAAGRFWPVLAGCLLTLIAPALLSTAVHRTVTHSVNEVLHGDSQRAQVAGRKLQWLSPLIGAELDSIVNAYVDESDPQRRAQLRKSYLEITGEDLETRLRVLQD